MRHMDGYGDELESWETARAEFADEYSAFETDAGAGYEYEYSTQSAYTEAEELEYAAELLEITDEAELDQFLGALIRRAGQAAGRFVRSDAGRALGGLLKNTVKKALPVVGRAVGGYFGGPSGAQLGARIAPMAGRIFGLELEGMSPEDQEFETARRIVRLAQTAASNLASLPQTHNPLHAARAAIAAAATRHAPGLIRSAKHPIDPDNACPRCGAARSGHWRRHGRNIVVIT